MATAIAQSGKFSMKRALVTGITGQDGAYLAELLLSKGYEVHGVKRRSSLFNTDRIDHLYQDPHVDGRRLILHYGDMTDSSSLIRIMQQAQPDEVYNLAAQSHVAVSFEEPEYTANSDALGPLQYADAPILVGQQPHKHAPIQNAEQGLLRPVRVLFARVLMPRAHAPIHKDNSLGSTNVLHSAVVLRIGFDTLVALRAVFSADSKPSPLTSSR